MPSPFGHALAGLAVGLLAESPDEPRATWARRSVSTFAAIAALTAALPDTDLLYPGLHRGITHSIGATIALTIIAAAVTRWVTGRVRWRWVVMLAAAQASHTLLDWLGTDRYDPAGIQALWPFSDRFYISGWDVFPPTERRIFLPGAIMVNLRALIGEIAIVGPIAAISWFAATRRRKSRVRSSVPGGLPRPFA
jgi:membrane-bound metal-dependent hydrolase YbcI (DUF457 family)